MKYVLGEIGMLCCYICFADGTYDAFKTIHERRKKLNPKPTYDQREKLDPNVEKWIVDEIGIMGLSFWFHDGIPNICEKCFDRITKK
ncbi:MAG: hypothetical protein ACTSUE_18180 [Promethearchaeota archaeon]